MPSDQTFIFRRPFVAALCLAMAWLFHRQMIVPLQKREMDTRQKIADLRGRIGPANRALDEFQALKQRAALGVAELDRFRGELSEGSVMAWFPVRISQSLARSETQISSIRLNTTLPASGLPRCERSYWHVVVPVNPANHGIAGLLLTLAEFEQQEPFVRVLDLAASDDPANPGHGSAAINIAVLGGQVSPGSDSR